jgi:hypothetical protein
LVVSQIGYSAVIVMTIWNYNHKFTMLVAGYNLIQTYVCLKAVVNSKFESYVACLIIGIALAVHYLLKLLWIR